MSLALNMNKKRSNNPNKDNRTVSNILMLYPLMAIDKVRASKFYIQYRFYANIF